MSKSRNPPSSAAQTRTLFRYELTKHFYSKRTIAVLVGMALLSATVTLFLHQLYYAGNTPQALVSNSVVLVTILVMLGSSSVLFGSDTLLADFSRKTGFFLFPNPVTRKTIWLAKFLWLELMVLIVIAIHAPVSVYGALLLHESVTPYDLALFYLFSFLVGTATQSMIIFYSAISKSSLMSIMASTATMAALPLIELYIKLQYFISEQLFLTPPAVFFTYDRILHDTFVGQIQRQLVPTLGSSDAVSIAILVAYAIGLCAASLHFYSKREL